MKNVSGIVCLVVGGLLIYWGYHMSQAIGSQLNNIVNGSPGDKPMLFYIGGAVLVLVGLGRVAWR